MVQTKSSTEVCKKAALFQLKVEADISTRVPHNSVKFSVFPNKLIFLSSETCPSFCIPELGYGTNTDPETATSNQLPSLANSSSLTALSASVYFSQIQLVSCKILLTEDYWNGFLISSFFHSPHWQSNLSKMQPNLTVSC